MGKYTAEHWAYVTTPGKWPGVDFLRAAAVLLVLLFHLNVTGMRFGWIGVDLFFVISGFLIGGGLWEQMKEQKFTFSRFYLNRALRILPIYYLFIALVCLSNSTWVGDLDLSDRVSFESLVQTMLFLQTTFPYFAGTPFDHRVAPGGSWSLVIEEYFYLAAPILLYFVMKVTPKHVLAFVVLIALSGIFVRYASMSTFSPDDPNWHFANFVQAHSRYEELAYGVIVGILVRQGNNAFFESVFLAFGAALIGGTVLFLAMTPPFWDQPNLITRDTLWLPTVLGLGFAALTYGACGRSLSPLMVTLVARLSFPMYLGHIWLITAVFRPLGFEAFFSGLGSAGWPAFILVQIGVSFAFAYLLSICVEYPFIRYYRKSQG